MSRCCVSLFVLLVIGGGAARAVELESSLATLRAVGPKGQGNRPAAEAWSELARADAADLPAMLAALDTAEPLAANWIRAAIDTVAERTLREHGSLPVDALEQFLRDTFHHPQARRLAYEWLCRADSAHGAELLTGFLDDPSTELRREAVADVQARGEAALAAGQRDLGRTLLEQAFAAARDLDQVDALRASLGDLGVEVDLPRHFGFLQSWRLIGPFDNSERRGYAAVYPPERELRFDATYDGKQGPVAWQDYSSSDDYGMVNLFQAYEQANDVVFYAAAQFESATARPAELRLGCVNAAKVWLNGELVAAHEVYHSGTQMDQYIVPVQLRAGANVVLVKILHNEQTESWAQKCEFQLRVCDRAGTPVIVLAGH